MMENCRKCDLHKYRRNIVLSREIVKNGRIGKCDHDILMVGEAPGKSEDLIGLPFIGMSGKLLDQLIEDAFLKSNTKLNILLTNTVFCRPCDYRKGPNREPNEIEVLSCRSNLMELLHDVRPVNTILVGKVAEKYLTPVFRNSVTILHPSFILRSGGKRSSYALRTVQLLTKIFSEAADEISKNRISQNT